MDKTSKIDFGADRLLSIAADAIENHNYITALKMLNKNAVLNGNDEDSFMLYAEAFDDMGLYEKCVNGWFKYIDYAEDLADFAEAYEGLAISFMNMGQESFAAYYYNKLLMETNVELTPENRQEIINSFLTTEKKPLKFAYPPQLADYSEEIESGINFMRSNDYDNAIGEFSKVDEGNEKYLAARNYIAMCEIISDRCEQAEEECSDVQALTTLAAVKSQQKKSDEAKELANRLLSLNAESPDDIYKIATVCCENKMHAQAYELLSKLGNDLDYDFSILFFKAISAYNSGKIEESLNTFDTILTVYPNATTAEYWRYTVSKNAKLAPEERAELEYFYRLPREESQTNLEFMSAFARLTDKMAKKLCENADIETCVHWCFDEGDSNNSYELRMLGATCAVKAGLDDTVRDILLDAFVPDGIKMEAVNELVQRDIGGEYGIVVCNLYRRLTLLPLDTGRYKRKTFLRAYGMAFSRFAMLEENYCYLLNAATTKLYNKLESEDRLDEVRSVPALAAAIVKSSDIIENGLTDENMLSFFGADKQKVNALLGE